MGEEKNELEQMSEEEIKRVVNGFKRRMDYFKYKPDSKAFKSEQASFFAGALFALNKKCDGFIICANAGRNILEYYKKYLD